MKRFMLGLAVLIVSCTAFAQQPLNVWIKLSPVTTEQGVVYGTTNLPDGTIFNLYLAALVPNDNFDWRCIAGNGAKAVVSHGLFSRTLTNGRPCLKPGARYISQATMEAPFLQPASVIAIIGKDGSNLIGPLVSGTAPFADVQTQIPVEVQ